MSVARHTLYNLAGAIFPALVTIVTLPFYLDVIGLERYGVLSICWLLIGYFNIFDFGIGRAVAQRLAALGKAPDDERNRIFWSAFGLTACLAFLAIAVFLLVGHDVLEQLRKESGDISRELEDSFPLLALMVPLSLVQSLFSGIMLGRSQFLWNNLATALSALLTTLGALTVAWVQGPHLGGLIAVSIAARAFSVALTGVVAVRAVPIGLPRLAGPAELRAMLHFGGWMTVSSVISPILAFADRFVIGAMIGAASVAIYVIPFNLITQLLILPNALATALFPRLANAEGEAARQIADDANRTLAGLLTPMTALAVVAVGPGFTVWLGAKTAALATPPAVILLIGFWLNSQAIIPYVRLQTERRTDLIARIHLWELLPYLVMLYAGLKLAGLAGAAAAWAMRVAIDLYFMRRLANVGGDYGRRVLAHGALLIALAAYMLLIDQTDLLALSAAVVFCLAVSAAGLRSIPAEQRAALWAHAASISGIGRLGGRPWR